jgi:enoyl-CoA hydratase/carnithine racemase
VELTTLTVERPREGVLLVTLKRATQMNTLSLEVLDELEHVFRDTAVDPAVRAMVLTGEGRAFCCGAELKYYTTHKHEIGESPLAVRYNYLRRVIRLFTEIENFDRPVIAAINGYALGGGAELALACDFRIMAESARFGVPEVKLGAVPGAGGLQKLHRFVGRGRALEIILLGEPLTAEQAERYDLIYRRVPDDRLIDEALELGSRLAKVSPIALSYAKAGINLAMDSDVTSANLYALDAMTATADSPDQREGMSAFFEKREPKFPGFAALAPSRSRK